MNSENVTRPANDKYIAMIANHVFIFPEFVMNPGQICRVYTNEDHHDWCGFNHESGAPIWNNDGDCAYLKDGSNSSIDTYCYP